MQFLILKSNLVTADNIVIDSLLLNLSNHTDRNIFKDASILLNKLVQGTHYRTRPHFMKPSSLGDIFGFEPLNLFFHQNAMEIDSLFLD